MRGAGYRGTGPFLLIPELRPLPRSCTGLLRDKQLPLFGLAIVSLMPMRHGLRIRSLWLIVKYLLAIQLRFQRMRNRPFFNPIIHRTVKLSLLGLVCLLVLMGCCHSNSCLLEPNLTYEPPLTLVDSLPSPFKPLSVDEVKSDWGKELLIAQTFVREMDLYRAVTGFKRALILAPLDKVDRRLQMEYGILYSYYLGRKYPEVVQTFETSALTNVGGDFPAFKDLLIILYDSYQEDGQSLKAERLFPLIEKCEALKATHLRLYEMLIAGNIEGIEENEDAACFTSDELIDFIGEYRCEAKSVRKAQGLNAIIPGAGYYYVGLHKAAMTSFLINTLFTAAAYQLFERGDIAAGLIVASLETGWYIGGINGAGLAAKEYNQSLYESKARDFLVKQGLFPVLMLEKSF